MKTEVIDFRQFCQGKTFEPVVRVNRKKELYKLAIKVGVVTIVIASAVPIPPSFAAVATEAVEAAASGENPWNRITYKLLEILDPIAKIFGMIAGVAIMTGNGKIGLERLFWLSIGYITTRKVDDWIAFLGSM